MTNITSNLGWIVCIFGRRHSENKKKITAINRYRAASSIHRFHVTSQCFIATIFVSESLLRDLSVYGHSSHNYQRKINETLPEGSQGYTMPGICCAVTTVVRKPHKLQFYSIPKRLDWRNKLLASIRGHHWQLTSSRIRYIRIQMSNFFHCIFFYI